MIRGASFLLVLCLWSWSPGVAAVPPASGEILLVPIDDRPAVAQFAVMIGAIADQEVRMPPAELLGRFTRPGDPEGIDRWLRAQDYRKVDAVILSADMLAYGGLIASRSPRVPAEKALERLAFFRWFRKSHPRVPVYAFSVLMRVAPTAEASNRSWREPLARWAELKDRVPKTGDQRLAAELADLEQKLDPAVTADYLSARRRDLQVNLAMLELRKDKIIDSLILLQDDAREFGLHRQDQEEIRARLRELQLESAVPIYNGADEGSLSLLSRAVLEKYRRVPRVMPVYSSTKSREVIAPFEDQPLQYTVEHQILSSGARLADESHPADYLLYINAPRTSDAEFSDFTRRLTADVRQGKPVAIADILFPPPHYSGADERLIRVLEKEGLFDRLAAYAGWNTAGNALGTAIPQANLRILSAAVTGDSPEKAMRAQAAQIAFLLHRFCGDYIYHDVVRFEINQELRKGSTDPTDEFTGDLYRRINRRTEEQLRPRIEEFFRRHFRGRSYPVAAAGASAAMIIRDLTDLRIRLPWPRTFEVTVEYKVNYSLGN